jgi:hypothetical protein
VEQCLRAHSPGSGPAARLGAVAFIHRFGSALNAHLHFHCVVIDGVFDVTATGGVVFHAASGLEANAIAQLQAQVRRRVARACSCAAACCRTMTRRRWGNGNMAAASPSTARCASRPPTAPPRIAPARGPPLWAAAGSEHDPAADPLLQSTPAFEFDQRIAW